jgi:hypothetical protein
MPSSSSLHAWRNTMSPGLVNVLVQAQAGSPSPATVGPLECAKTRSGRPIIGLLKIELAQLFA